MTFELQPTIVGELIHLRPLRFDDFEKLYSCAADPLVWEQHPQPNRFQREIFKAFFDSAIQSGGAFAVIDKATSEIIGSSRYYEFSSSMHQITIGYTFLTRKYWGGRFNRELKDLMLKHAYKFVDSVVFEIGASNVRSRKAIEKLGATLFEEQTLDNSAYVVYRMLKSEYLPKVCDHSERL